MELFSKRYKNDDNFLSEGIKVRLQQELKYIIKSNEYLEKIIIVHHEEKDEYYLENDTLKDLSMRELGYDITAMLEDIREFNYDPNYYSDNKLFDLVELLLIFTRKDRREDFVNRLDKIFREEETLFVVHEWMLFKKESTGLNSIIPLIKNKQLKTKLDEFFENNKITKNFQTKAKVGADLVQLIFSSNNKKSNTKKYTEKICLDIAKKWAKPKDIKSLSELISNTVKNAKDLSNQIYNIRHTDQHTIPIDSPNFYKLIAENCISLVELVILSMPEKYIFTENAEKIKDSYLGKYKLDKDAGWIIPGKKPGGTNEVSANDIPF